MRFAVLLAVLCVAGCGELAQRSGADAGDTSTPKDPGRPVNGPIVSPPGFFHLPYGTKAATLHLQPDRQARFWFSECDFTALSSLAWDSTSASTIELSGVELDGGTSIFVLTFQDGGTAVADPPLYPERGVSPEVWLPGAVCSVCLPGHPLAVVGRPTPDAGVVAVCCEGGCGGGRAFNATCTFGLLSGETGDAVAAGNCVCPVGTVSVAECTDYPRVFCGGG